MRHLNVQGSVMRGRVTPRWAGAELWWQIATEREHDQVLALMEHLNAVGSVARSKVTPRWVGAEPWWQIAMEREAMREHPGDISLEVQSPILTPNSRMKLVYRHRGLRVRGLTRRFPVEIHFWESPPYDTYGIPALDYPRVFADRKAISKHRMPDDALCLWFPRDPEEQRWVQSDGLAMLLRLTANHLLCEELWRQDGADERDSRWLSAEAPHGLPTRPASSRAMRRRRSRAV